MSHPQVQVPICAECHQFTRQVYFEDIWQCRDIIKRSLRKKYHQHLAIGDNWTQQELLESEFDDNAFGGFKKSAWMMYEIAKQRVNANGWPIVIDGVEYLPPLTNTFKFNGLVYANVAEAVHQQCRQHALDEAFVIQMIEIVGQQRFAYVIRLAKLYRGLGIHPKKQLISELLEEFSQD
ncbi:hypothetical protein [Shewanella sp. NIFS-20-20]|uniref:hypothetical protein n=1 Tax=Shewanella sp. NIFS-20-20 TaxID=2853806 RepID=UPI001C476A4D|nr:hypothetical protein [Shewanella sp. NIFS-20-20]MBV7314327.1 hypothetical protein [Shewanella sp. NIFS-20-20]